MPGDQPVDKIMTVAPGEAISGLTPYEPIPLALTYEVERFGKTIESFEFLQQLDDSGRKSKIS